ncbi:MAG: toprim domain-containing protein [Thiothrix sp.]|uniref:toprim domain-containing protein n=1 Tax=Thiothrix sp. TaxID=1032 RepID=UPI002614CD71|nr:toprim domain-containing protein [Thiothrix sp.]MDD5394431.1 toprim domain-containing protein [Thiothrix sp.]
MQRFSSNGKAHDKAGWYVCHETHLLINGANKWGIIGTFGDWRTGNTHQWNSYSTFFRLSREERSELVHRQQVQAAQLRAQRQAAADQAHRKAVKMWLSAQPASTAHPYLMRKRVGAYNIRQVGNLLLIPLCDLDGTLHSVQTIVPNGTKHFLSGTPKRGMFHLIGDRLDHPQGVYLCEGYATGASLYEAYRLPVLVGFDAGNLFPVVSAYRARFPHTPLTICADNDRDPASKGYMVGVKKAREVCAAFPGVGLIVPEFPAAAPLKLSDFNDLATLLGGSVHKEIIP